MMLFDKDAEAALEKATIQHFEEQRWTSLCAQDEVDGDPTLLGREHHGEVILKKFLIPALNKL